MDAPNYICYCDKVTEEDIREAIRGGASTVAEVIQGNRGYASLRLQGEKSQGDVMFRRHQSGF